MTFEDAVAEVALLASTDVDPVLSADEVAALVTRARRPDSNGRVPSDADWTPTFDVSWAVRQAWLAKAGRASGRYAVSTDGQSLNRQQVVAHCLEMARRYARIQTVPLRGGD